MPSLPKPFRPGGQRTRVEANRESDQYRGSPRERGYSAAWDKASVTFRRNNPLCQYCAGGAFGEVRVSLCTRVDHLYPQRRYPGVFWRTEWWVASCDDCDAAKQALERQGRQGLDDLARALGRPTLDPTPGGV